MQRILVTGGCGYIGSHTLVDLIQNGFEVVSIDNNSRSTEWLLTGVEKITGKNVENYKVDLCDLDAVKEVFRKQKIDGVIHFAAYKAVDESVKEPLLYYRNNFASLVNLLDCIKEFSIPYFVFSSSCSVYGDVEKMPVTEDTLLAEPKSPYGRTKKVGEEIIKDFAKSCDTRFILLRYFNPVGAHPSALIGEIPFGAPTNLVPAITQFAAGRLPALRVYGSEYTTRDGSCVRDFVHVCDIAAAHTLAVKRLSRVAGEALSVEIYNLGTGNGVTVFETIKAFEKVTGIQLNYQLAPARDGDVIAIYANNDKARNNLGWKPLFRLEEMMKTAWAWELANQAAS